MHKSIVALSILLGISSMNTQAEGWEFLAGSKPGYKAEPIASLMFGQMDFDGSDSSIVGVELSLNCPLLQPPTNRIRQQASITSYDDSGFEIINLEINPHYVVEVAKNLEIGGGPGFGYLYSDDTADRFAFNLGASIHYTGLPVFLGAEVRTQFTTEDNGNDMNNNRMAVKIGYAF